MSSPAPDPIASADIDLDRDIFMRSLIRHLSGALENVVGSEHAAGFISVVGNGLGDTLDRAYRRALSVDGLDRNQVALVMVDLKRRIGGDFRVVEADEEKIVLANGRCPFGGTVLGRPSLCMMTSNVFGKIAAANLGYARVELRETIARGDAGCTVVIHLVPDADPRVAVGREYTDATAI